ncbi:MAG: NAD(P)/FAD-dependent oxidoreductase [Ruminococcus sp.]|nr:NAD(P)/FAD-dependent oxidoreductase [Ruminococcus sp.]
MAKAVIVGGGVAGLSAGIFAQLTGFDTEILEAHQKAGGNLTGWDRGEYHIDNCIHWLTGTNPVTDLYGMWETLGALGGVDIYQPETLYTYSLGGKTLSLIRDIGKLEQDMRAYSEDDDREISLLINAIRAAMTLSGISANDNHKRASTSEVIRYAPRLLRYYLISAAELADRFHSPMIRGFLRSLLGESFGAIALLFVFATFCSNNGGIPAGSSCAMADRMVQRYQSLGGVLRCSCAVRKIEVDSKRARSVTLHNGRTVEADYVILACEPACAFGRMLDRDLMPKKIERRYRDQSLKRFSSVHCAFSVDVEMPFSGDLIVDLPYDLQKELQCDYLVLREFSHEKSFAPEGKNLLQTICFCDEDVSRRFIRLRSNQEEYRRYKVYLSGRISDVIRGQFPSLLDSLSLIDCWTPATYSRYTHSPTGSYMSFAFPSGRLPRFIGGRVRGVENLILATQWQQAPGGLPSAAFAGQKAAGEIIRLEQRRKNTEPVWRGESVENPVA